MKVRRLFVVTMFVATMLIGSVASVGAAPSASHCTAPRTAYRWSVPAQQRYSTFKQAQIDRADGGATVSPCSPSAAAARKAPSGYAAFKDRQAGN